MAESISFKAYLKREGQDVEVRRFGIDMGAATNYMYLRSKIQAVFPSIQDDQFSIFWQDCENDYVTISSDEELMIALSAVNAQPVKIYIQIKAKEQPAPGIESPQVHQGVVCDSCDSAVVGFRYKCVTCPDFDLCAQCEASGQHSEHLMLRISTPQGAGAASCPKLVRKLFFGRPHKLHKRSSWGHGHGESGAGLGKPHGCPYTQKQGPRSAADMFDFSTLMNVFNGLGLHIPEDQPASQTQAASSTQAAPPTAQASSSAQAPPANTAGEQRKPPQGTEYLTGIGQAIAAFLDPLDMPEEKKQKMMKKMLLKTKAKPSKKYTLKSLLKLHHQFPQKQNLEAFHSAGYLDSYQVPRGHTRHGNVPYGRGPHENGPHNHVPHGNGPHGHGPLENGPHGHGHLGNGPHGNRPQGHGPHGNGHHSYGLHGNGPIGLRPGVSHGHGRRRPHQKRQLVTRRGPLGHGQNGNVPQGHGPHGKGPYGHENGLHRGCLPKKRVLFHGHGDGLRGHVAHEHGFLGTCINPVIIIDDEHLQVEICCEDNAGMEVVVLDQ